jgi:nucleoside phosphorylase
VPGPGTSNELLLGDVVISKLVVQYDFGRQYPGVFEMKDTTVGLPKGIQNLIAHLETDQQHDRIEQQASIHLEAIQAKSPGRSGADYKYIGTEYDHLFPSKYRHKHRQENITCACASQPPGSQDACEESRTLSCDILGCEEEQLIQRKRLHRNGEHEHQGLSYKPRIPKILFGGFASGDIVVKDGETRDQRAKQLSSRFGIPILAFEMEGAGLVKECPCLIIKGVCDYADSHKNKQWQNFAAATAASVTKAVIEAYPRTKSSGKFKSKWQQRETFKTHQLIPLPRNEDIILRPLLSSKLDNLLPMGTNEQYSAALWGLGGSG